MDKWKKVFLLSLTCVVLFYGLTTLKLYYFNTHKEILDCAYIIGPIIDNECLYQEGQEKIIAIYKILFFLPYVFTLASLITSILSFINNKKDLVIRIMSILLIIYNILVIRSFIKII